MKKFSVSNDVWRSLTGLLIGILLAALSSHAIFADSKSVVAYFLPLAYPVGGFLALVDYLHLPFFEQVIVPVGIAIFYPVILTLLFFLAGRKQARYVLLGEGITIAVLLVCIYMGYWISQIAGK